MHKRLERLAKRKGKPVTGLVNQLFKRDRSCWKACVTPGGQTAYGRDSPNLGEPLPLSTALIHITNCRGSSRQWAWRLIKPCIHRRYRHSALRVHHDVKHMPPDPNPFTHWWGKDGDVSILREFYSPRRLCNIGNIGIITPAVVMHNIAISPLHQLGDGDETALSIILRKSHSEHMAQRTSCTPLQCTAIQARLNEQEPYRSKWLLLAIALVCNDCILWEIGDLAGTNHTTKLPAKRGESLVYLNGFRI